MKKHLIWILKVLVSGVLTFVILTMFCFLYYNVPVHSTTADGATDYSWEKNKYYSRATEGFASGRTNNDGYINTFDYYEGMEIDVLLMGSSHMEGYNVAMNQNTASQLNSLYGYNAVYNIGVSGHTFLRCCNNFEAALEKYKPKKYVIIETSSLAFSEEELQLAIDGTMENLPSHSEGIVGILQKNQFFRLLYTQLSNWADVSNAEEQSTAEAVQKQVGSKEMYLQLLNKLSKIANEHGVKLLVFHQSNIHIDSETGLAIQENNTMIKTFAEYCDESGIEFLDMTNRFVAEYNNSNILAHGFSNTSVGAGHLNKHGHRMIAEELFRVVGG